MNFGKTVKQTIGGWCRGRRPSPRDRLLKVNVQTEDQKRRKTRRMYGVLLVPLVLLLAVGLAWFFTVQANALLFSENPRYVLQRMEIQAEGPAITPAHIREYARQFGLVEGANLFALDIGKIREQFLHAAPSIKGMSITRKLPHTIGIEVSERVPIARVGRWKPMGIDREGYIYHLRTGARELPLIAGYFDKNLKPGSQANGMIMSAIEVLDVCNSTQYEYPIKIESIDISSGEYLDVRLVAAERVRLAWANMDTTGPESRKNLAAKLERLALALRSAANRGRRIAQIDLTFDDQYTPAQEY